MSPFIQRMTMINTGNDIIQTSEICKWRLVLKNNSDWWVRIIESNPAIHSNYCVGLLLRKFNNQFAIKKSLVASTRPLCARDWIRTSTPLRALRPEHSASTNFATRAGAANVN